jgi:hypothetical protein
MPAVMIRQLDALAKIIEQTADPAGRRTLLRQADLIQRANLRSVREQADRADVTGRYDAVVALYARGRLQATTSSPAPDTVQSVVPLSSARDKRIRPPTDRGVGEVL